MMFPREESAHCALASHHHVCIYTFFCLVFLLFLLLCCFYYQRKCVCSYRPLPLFYGHLVNSITFSKMGTPDVTCQTKRPIPPRLAVI
jgi:hypothetical protein